LEVILAAAIRIFSQYPSTIYAGYNNGRQAEQR